MTAVVTDNNTPNAYVHLMFHLLPVRLPERTSTDQNAGVNDLLVTCYLCVQMGWEKASAFVCDHPVCY